MLHSSSPVRQPHLPQPECRLIYKKNPMSKTIWRSWALNIALVATRKNVPKVSSHGIPVDSETRLFYVYIRKPTSQFFVFNLFALIHVPVCHLLGDYLESIKKDFEKASKVYRSNCDDYGYSRSCYKFGNYSFLGKGRSGGKSCASEALTYYEKGCNLKDADSCLHSGLILVSRTPQENVKRDVPRVC